MRCVVAALALGYVAVASAFVSGVLFTALSAIHVMLLLAFHPACASTLGTLASPQQRQPPAGGCCEFPIFSAAWGYNMHARQVKCRILRSSNSSLAGSWSKFLRREGEEGGNEWGLEILMSVLLKVAGSILCFGGTRMSVTYLADSLALPLALSP